MEGGDYNEGGDISDELKKLILLLALLKAGDDSGDAADFDPSQFEEIDTEGKAVLGQGYFGRVVEWDKKYVMKII